MPETLLSVGVDIGTATTKIVVSRLTLEKTGLATGAPRVAVTAREILYRSRLHATPVAGAQLDPGALLACLTTAYAEAGIDPGQVESGGVIITGEAARKENARLLADLLADRAGQFVVATAGPHLEAILAGRGSGAAAHSEATGRTVASVDIGGGTANIALFRDGRVLETAVVNLGGKSVRLNHATGEVTAVTAAARATGLLINPGDTPDLHSTGAILAGAIAGALQGEPGPAYDGRPLSGKHPIDEVFLSGGVATAADQPLLAYGDIGPAIGLALPHALAARGLRIGRPAETAFATVIGVGLHHLHLSGATIHIPDPAMLPLTNLPVLSLAAEQAFPEHGPAAIALGRLPDISLGGLKPIARRIAQVRNHPLVVIAEQDIAAALGLLLHAAGARHIITVDEVPATEGAYIDMGRPLYGGAVVPVVVKTLIFAGEGERQA